MRETLTKERIKARVRQLLALASSSSSENEKRLASTQAEKLMREYGLSEIDKDDKRFTYSDNPLTTNAQSFILTALCIAHNVTPRYTLLTEDSSYFTREVALSGSPQARRRVRGVYEDVIKKCQDELDRLNYRKTTMTLNSIYCGVAESLLSRLPPDPEPPSEDREKLKVSEPPTQKHLFDEGKQFGDTLSFSTLLQLEQGEQS
jgi:hypothetical protein|nr:MAG TPA: Protein of unknown function (DUF2786) [Caudoviricetes sp.]